MSVVNGGSLSPPDRSAGSKATRVAPRPRSTVTIRVHDLEVGFGDKIILNHLSLEVYQGEILGVIGASGSGKSVLTRAILGLVPKRHGTIEVFGQDLDTLSPEEYRVMERRWGVLFQGGALFSSLTVKQNIQFPLREDFHLSKQSLEELAMIKIEMVGLPADAADKYPAELSGGMTKRAALARALALDPELLFLDEPTSGLDPIGIAEIDALIAMLHKTLQLTIFMVTHDLTSLRSTCDRIAALKKGEVIATGTFDSMLSSKDPWLQEYFRGVQPPTSDRQSPNSV